MGYLGIEVIESKGYIYYNTGNVGIGTATLIGSPLCVYSPTAKGGLKLVGGSGIANDNWWLAFNHAGGDIIDGSDRSRIGCSIESGGAGSLFFTTGNNGTQTERLRIASNGNIGIGTNNPGFKLEVAGNIATDAGTFSAYYLGGSGVSTYGGPWTNTSAKFIGNVWCTTNFITNSDVRIKEYIEDINDDTALQSILSIEPKTYKYIDKLERGNKKVYGFIAQQVKEIIPEIVSIQIFYIPNIYLVANYNSNVITLSSQSTKVVIKVDDKIKCYDKDNKEILVEVVEVIDDLTFRIKDIEYSDTEIFVYGTEVDDFHTLNKDYIFTLNVCATQELHRRIEAQSLLIKSQDDRIKDLETKMERLLSGTT